MSELRGGESDESSGYAVVMNLLVRSLFVAALGLMLVGCPRAAEELPPPTGTPCEADADCNSADCGQLHLCVGGRCSEEATLIRPCDEGVRVGNPDED